MNMRSSWETFLLMTATGTFVINGAERVIVSQLVRSPGIYYAIGHDKIGKELYSSTVIPNRGAWLEYETDSNDVFYVRVDRNRKVPITVFLRALGLGHQCSRSKKLFGEEPKDSCKYREGYNRELSGWSCLNYIKSFVRASRLSVDSAENLIKRYVLRCQEI